MISFDLASWIDVLNQFPILISIFPAIIGGEAAIIGLSFLSQQGLVRLDYVVLFGLIGAVLSDFLWFALTKTKIVQKFKEWKIIKI